ncbi:MAG TPA: HEAT repeat domain-containing protein [Ktedonobacteraceae bacterium]
MIEKTITERLIDPDYRVRMRTIHILVERGNAEAVLLLLPLLHDREMPVRCAAIVALGTFADRRAYEPLVTSLATPISLERKNAVQALVASGDPRRRDAFLDALKTEMNTIVRVQLIKAISVFPEEKVLEILIEELTNGDEDVRAVAAVALGKMGQPQAIPALQQMALTDTNQETSIHGLAIQNSAIAKQAIQIILHPEQEQSINWPDITNL